jgi:iron-sulfur cluster assembly accessory protein
LNSELIEQMDTPAMLETRTTCSIYVTSAAANQVRATGGAGEYLRISVQSIGCSGFRYQISVDDTVDHGDNTCNSNGVDIVVDAFSTPYLQGATIDYIGGFDGNGFTIDNPHCTEF